MKEPAGRTVIAQQRQFDAGLRPFRNSRRNLFVRVDREVRQNPISKSDSESLRQTHARDPSELMTSTDLPAVGLSIGKLPKYRQTLSL